MIPQSISSPVVSTTISNSDSSDSSTGSEQSICGKITRFLPQEAKKEGKKETSKKLNEFLEQSPVYIAKVTGQNRKSLEGTNALYSPINKERRTSLGANKVPFTGDIFSEVFLNSNWEKKLLECLKEEGPLTIEGIMESLKKELYEAIDRFYWKHLHITSTPSGGYVKEEIPFETISQGLAFDALFLRPFIERFKRAKQHYEIVIQQVGSKTYEGEHFRNHLRSLIHSENSYKQFMGHLEILRKNKELYKLVNRITQLTEKKDLLLDLPLVNQRCKAMFENVLQELHWFHKEAPFVVQKQIYYWSDAFSENFSIDKIKNFDAIRSLTMHGQLLLDLSINGIPAYKLHDSYLTGIIHQISLGGLNPFMSSFEAAEEARTFAGGSSIAAERVLKMCSIGCWYQADKLIRKWFGDLYEIPLHTTCNQGIACAITINGPNDYKVVQQKTFTVHKRRIPNDPECFTVQEPAVGEIKFEWAVWPTSEGIKGTLRIAGWKLNDAVGIEEKWLFLRAITHFHG